MVGVGVRGQRGEELAIRREVVELVVEDAAQAGFERACARSSCSSSAGCISRLGPLVKGHDDGVLGVEVVVGGPDGDFGLGGDLAHGGALEAALAEDGERGFKDAGCAFPLTS